MPEDVNKDGIVNIQDLTLVAANFGQTGPNAADVNGDGIVDIRDLVKVASAMVATVAAPSTHPQALAMLTAAEVREWLTQAQQLNLTDAISQRGIRFLEQLLDALTPKETALLPNYPEPIQSRNVDTLSVSGASRGHGDHLCSGRNSGADIGIRTSTYWYLSDAQSGGALGWEK